MAGFRVALHARHRLVTELVPNDFSGGLVQREQPPLVRLLILRGCDVAVKPHLEIGLTRSRRSRDVNAIGPDDWGSVRESGQWRAPTDGLALLNIPPRWKRRVRL